MINRTKVKESTQIKPGDNGDVLVMKDNAPEWSTPSDADLAKASETDTKLAEKQDKLTAGDNIHIVGNTISADGKPTPIAIGTVTSGEVPMVSNSGTDTDVVLNFVLPKGDKGDKGDQGLQGPQGPVGAPFQVKKIYDSVEAMNADYSGSDVAVGEFVLIDTGDVQDPDNSKLYVKGPTQYDFVTDLSGAQGIQGPQGNPGTDAGFGNVTATVDNTTGTPQVSVQSDGPNTAKNISFSFTGLKGEKGDKGDPGRDGTQINTLSTPNTTGVLDFGEDTESLFYGYAMSGNPLDVSESTAGFQLVGVGRIANDEITSDDPPYVDGGIVVAPGSGGVVIGRGFVGHSIIIGEPRDDYTSGTGRVAIGVDIGTAAMGENAVAIGGAMAEADDAVAIGRWSYTKSSDAFAVGQDDASAGRDQVLRRIVGVKDPTQEHDAANKNYVDTQLEPINAKLQYVPENTNQILSQIQTNVEKAQAAAEAAQTTADGTQSSLTTLQNTVNQQAETIAQLQQTITQLQATINNLTLETERI